MKEIKYKECYVVGDCLHIQFVDGESYNFLLDSVVEEMAGGLTPLAPDVAYWLCKNCGAHQYKDFDTCGDCNTPRG